MPPNTERADAIPDALITSQLERILATETFSRSARLTAFLQFVVEQTVCGQGHSLKEQVLACELYGRTGEFGDTDSVVRVDARRLRDKLREYYTDHPSEPVVISLPRGGYVPAFSWGTRISPPQPVPPDALTETLATQRHVRKWWTRRPAAALLVGAIGPILVVAWLATAKREGLPSRVLPLTSSLGNETWPSLSPDGNFVAFACSSAEAPRSPDICVKPVEGEAVQRTVETPVAEFRPAWSPDGRDIAFARVGSASDSGIFIVSRVGGFARRVSKSGTTVAWFPDGKSLLIRDRVRDEPYAMFRLDLETLKPYPLTRPLTGEGDWSFDVSPDGKTIAFIRAKRPGVSDLYVMPAHGGEPKRITEWDGNLAGPSWTPDGKELIYAARDRLWRVSPRTGRSSVVSEIPFAVGQMSMSRPPHGQPVRLAFQTRSEHISLRLVDLETADAGGSFKSVALFAPATRRDVPGRFSPDGSKIAFTSTRASSDYELWVADTDGRNLRQLTTMRENRGMLAHSWSPDGSRIVFDTAVRGNNDVYIISADGGNPVRLTNSPAIEGLAEWSSDGRWIYYTNVTHGGVSHIWRISASGGPPEQVTTENSSEPQISPDGRYLYYLDRPPVGHSVSARLMRMPAAGGEAQPVCEGLTPSYWSVTNKGVYFLVEDGSVHSIHLYRFPDGQVKRVGTLPFRVTNIQGPGRLTVSRDGRWALVNVTDRTESDLMLLENFR